MNRAAFLALFACSVVLMNSLDVLNQYFDKPHPIYLLYNILRIIQFAFLPVIVYGAGLVVCGVKVNQRPEHSSDLFDEFVLVNIFGVAALTVFVFVMGLINLYYWWLMLILVSPLVYFAYPKFNTLTISSIRMIVNWCGSFGTTIKSGSLQTEIQAGQRTAAPQGHRSERAVTIANQPELSTRNYNVHHILKILLLLAVLVQLSGIFVTRVLYPEFRDNDEIGALIPYFTDVLYKFHGFWPTNFFISYYCYKSCAVQFLSMLFGDVHSARIAGFYLILLICLVLVLVVRRVLISPAWGLVALVLLCRSELVSASLMKNHVATAAYIIFTFYLALIASDWSKEKLQNMIFGFVLFFMGAVVNSPQTTPIIIAFLGGLSVLSILNRNYFRTLYCTGLGVVAGLTLLLIYYFNWHQTGLIDFSSPLWDKYINWTVFKEWLSPAALLIQRAANAGDGNIAGLTDLNWTMVFKAVKSAFYDRQVFSQFASGSVTEILIMIILASSAAFAWIRVSNRRVCKGDGNGNKILVLCLLMQFITMLLFTFATHDALYRVTAYRSFFFVLLFLWGTMKLVDITPWYRFRTVVAFLAILLISFLGFKSFWNTLVSSSRVDTWKLLYGDVSYAQSYDSQWLISDYLFVQQHIIPGERVIALNFAPGAYGLPGNKFQRPLQCDYKHVLHVVLYGNPEQARVALLKLGIHYAYFENRNPLLYTVLAPLFAPDVLRSQWRQVWHGKDGYLLTLLPDRGTPVDEGCIQMYEDMISRHFIHQEKAF